MLGLNETLHGFGFVWLVPRKFPQTMIVKATLHLVNHNKQVKVWLARD